jgi:hypothetical protein
MVLGGSPADRIISHAGTLSLDEAADLYRAYAARILIDGQTVERQALAEARRVAHRSGVLDDYEAIRRAAVRAWRRALPEEQGPWLFVGRAIANAAGAVYLQSWLDHETYLLLVGPWRQAVGLLTPVGPGSATAAETPHGLIGSRR